MNGINMHDVKINILGSCICRDIFGISENVFPDIPTVFRFYQFSNPFVYMSESPKEYVDKACLENLEVSNFFKKCVVGDINKSNIYDCLDGGDYFVFDLTEFRFPVAKVNIDGKVLFVTYTEKFKTALDYISKKYTVGDISVVDLSLDEKKETVDKLLCLLKTKYDSKRIIMIENYLVNEYYDLEEGEYIIEKEGYANRINKELKDLYNYAYEVFPEISIVKSPSKNIGNIRHKWGKDSLHFFDDYYYLFYQQIRNIILGCDEISAYFVDNYFINLRKKFLLESLSNSMHLDGLLPNNNFLIDGFWDIIMSKQNSFDVNTGILKCEGGYGILSNRNILIPERARTGYICFSVCGETIGSQRDNEIYLAFGYYENDKFISIVTDNKVFVDKPTRKAITCNVSKYGNVNAFACRIYSTNSNADIKFWDARLDIGSIPFDLSLL